MPRRPRKPFGTPFKALTSRIFAGPGSSDALALTKKGRTHNQPGPDRQTFDKGRFVLPQKLPKRWSTL